MIDPTLTEVAKQVPALIVLAFVVKVFLAHIEASRNSFLDAIKQIQSENVEQRGLTRDVIKDNTIATRIVNESIIKLIDVVTSLEKRTFFSKA